MANEPNHSAVRYLRTIFDEGIAPDLTDRELLERYTSRVGESSEMAFAALVARHGPMVLQTCLATLRDEHDAQDAFQAVFLVLVLKARSIWVRDSLGPWLHAAALRVAAGARASSALRRTHERKLAETVLQSRDERGGAVPDLELGTALHEEVARLPEGYRMAVVLCDLEGLTHEEAARRLGWPLGTVKSRQARGRERLRSRLERRGLVPLSGTIIAALSAGRATAAVPASLVDSTIKLAQMVSSGHAVSGVISTTAAVLTKGAIRAMFVARLRLAAGVVLLLGAAASAAGLAIHSCAVQQPPTVGTASANGRPIAPRPALDALRPADIPPEKRVVDLPESTVAVLGEVRGRHAGEVRGVAFHPDGKLVATIADQDMRIRLWDARTLLPISSLAGHRAFVNCVAISPDGRWLASGSAYGDFFVWDIGVTPPKGPIPLATRGAGNRYNNQLHAAAFSRDGKRLAVAGDAGSVELFDMSVAPPVSRGVLPGLDQPVHALTIPPHGGLLALAGLKDGSVRLCDVSGATPREVATLRQPGAEADDVSHRLISAAFSPDGATLITLEEGGGVWRWDLAGPQPVHRGLLNARAGDHPGMVKFVVRRGAVGFSPDSKMVVAPQSDGWVHFWDWNGGQPTERAKLLAEGQASGGVLAFSPDGKTLISGGRDHLIRAWDLAAAVPAERFPPQGPVGGLSGIAFSPDGTRLAVGDAEAVRLWDLTDAGGLSRLPPPKPTAKIVAGSQSRQPIAFSPDGGAMVCDGTIWAVRDGTIVSGSGTRFPGPAAGDMWSVAFSGDGRTLASGGSDHKVRIWDIKGNRPSERLMLDGSDQWPPVVAISPNGAHVAFSGPRHSIRLWVLAGLEPRKRARFDGNGWPISSLAFSPDGKVHGRCEQRRDPTLGCLHLRESQRAAFVPQLAWLQDKAADRRLPGIFPGFHLQCKAVDRGRPGLGPEWAEAVAAGDLRLRRDLRRAAARVGHRSSLLGDRAGPRRPACGRRPAGRRGLDPPFAREPREAQLRPRGVCLRPGSRG